MLFKSGRCNVKLEECEITLNQIPGEDLNYSDHVGLRARFTIDDRFRHEKSVNTWEPNRPLLIEAIGLVAGAEKLGHRVEIGGRTLFRSFPGKNTCFCAKKCENWFKKSYFVLEA